MVRDLKKLQLYIHIPFCVRKCLYCDFLSFAGAQEKEEAYLAALCAEIRSRAPHFLDYELSSIYIGGGTPNVLPAERIASVIDCVRENFAVRADAEISIECNPGAQRAALRRNTQEKEEEAGAEESAAAEQVDFGRITYQKVDAHRRALEAQESIRHQFAVYCAAGINRLSIGCQSVSERDLRILGRIHCYDDFLLTYQLARQAGFSNINVDLISGIPGQTPDSFAECLRQIIRLRPEHVSVYSLIIEEHTPFYEMYHKDALRQARGEITHDLPDEDALCRMLSDTTNILTAHGYLRYEISNFAKPGFFCRHNLGYWERAEYLGVGLGAASLLGNVRSENIRDLDVYLSCAREANADAGYLPKQNADAKKEEDDLPWQGSRQVLSRREQMAEFMFLGLRKIDGVSRSDFEKFFGVPIEAVYADPIRKLSEEDLLRQRAGRIFLTERGLMLSNYAMAQFL